MKLFIDTKTLKAMSTTRAEYLAYRGWKLPENENPEDEGYLVEYTDGGQASDPRHQGYISWSPKEVFDAAYIDIGSIAHLPSHQIRVIGEMAQLDDKVARLSAFTKTNFFQDLDIREAGRLVEQLSVMVTYLQILRDRVAAF